jgi:hypothetical protein
MADDLRLQILSLTLSFRQIAAKLFTAEWIPFD